MYLLETDLIAEQLEVLLQFQVVFFKEAIERLLHVSELGQEPAYTQTHHLSRLTFWVHSLATLHMQHPSDYEATLQVVHFLQVQLSALFLGYSRNFNPNSPKSSSFSYK